MMCPTCRDMGWFHGRSGCSRPQRLSVLLSVCLCLRVCARVCTNVCLCVCMCACAYTCLCTGMYPSSTHTHRVWLFYRGLHRPGKESGALGLLGSELSPEGRQAAGRSGAPAGRGWRHTWLVEVTCISACCGKSDLSFLYYLFPFYGISSFMLPFTKRMMSPEHSLKILCPQGPGPLPGGRCPPRPPGPGP